MEMERKVFKPIFGDLFRQGHQILLWSVDFDLIQANPDTIKVPNFTYIKKICKGTAKKADADILQKPAGAEKLTNRSFQTLWNRLRFKQKRNELTVFGYQL